MMAQWGPKLGSQSTDRQASHLTATEQCSCRFRHRRCTSQCKSLASESDLAPPAEAAPGARARLSVRVANLEAGCTACQILRVFWSLEYHRLSIQIMLHYHCLLPLDARPFSCLASSATPLLLSSPVVVWGALCETAHAPLRRRTQRNP